MWVILVLILLILAPFIYLLFAPFFVEIDSRHDIYKLRFHRLCSLSLVQRQHSLYALVQVAWWQREYDLFAAHKSEKNEERPAKASDQEKHGRPVKVDWRRIVAVILSFRIKKCHIMIDTGDMAANGILYPWAYLLSCHTGHTILVNFHGRNELVLQIQNRLSSMIWAYVVRKNLIT